MATISLNEESSEHAWIDNNDLDKYCLAFMNDNGVQKYWNDFRINEKTIKNSVHPANELDKTSLGLAPQ
jgi:hypothetical protein